VAKVRGTMKKVPNVEVNVDTVYIRNNIEKIEENEFQGWEYDEQQIPLKKYLETVNNIGEELAQERLKNTRKDIVINNLGQEVSKLKLEIIQLKGGSY
jgi:hypothetical protein